MAGVGAGMRLRGERQPAAATPGEGAAAPAMPGASTPPPAMPEDGRARLGEGFLVWESNRTGTFRIWYQRLDGSGLRQLSPDEAGRQHVAPHIAPGGKLLTYLSYAGSSTEYPPDATAGELHLMGVDGSEDRVIAPAARTYLENRAVVWHDDGRLIFVRGDGRTCELDIATGTVTPLFAGDVPPGNWLVNRQGTFATTGLASFSPVDPERRTILPRGLLGGCQPYFSADGRWGYWMAGAGGPLDRIDLQTRKITTILGKNDPRLPPGLGYVYFPMASRSGELLAFAASRNAHDHFRADYEVFVAETDPATLELVGPPVRYTTNAATDRFPDVYQEPLELGRLGGEAPFRVSFPVQEGAWEWDFGDGRSGERGPSASHTYESPGVYRVTARQADTQRRGQVRVAPARPPRVLEAVRQGERGIVVRFDEPVGLDKAKLALVSGHAIASWTAGPDRSSLELTLAETSFEPETLRLEGVEDRAQTPNVMAPTEVAVAAPRWPSRREGLVFLWETADSPNLVTDPTSGTERSSTLEPKGYATLDRNRAMLLLGGYFVAPPETGAQVAHACQATNSWSLEATIRPADLAQAGAAVIAMPRGGESLDFVLLQDAASLKLGLRTGRHDSGVRVPLVQLADALPHHLLASYVPGRLRAYLDGERVLDSNDLTGDFFHWSAQPLLFGIEGGSTRPWRGSLENVAIYNRAVGEEEARENARRLARRRAERKPVPRLEVVGKLAARSEVPTLASISPYREALVVFEYEVVKTLAGEAPGPRVRVAHWALLDGEALPDVSARPGSERRLLLEPHGDHPELESIVLSDTLAVPADAANGVALYHAVSF